MRRLFFNKRRTLGVFTTLVGASIIILSFQNCAPQKPGSTSGTGSSTSSSTSGGSSGSTIWGSRSGSSGSGGISAGGSGGSIYTGGGTGSSGGGSSGGGVIIGGGGGSGGGTGGGGTPGGGGTSDTTFRITTQPQSVSVLEGARYELKVVVIGGKTPYSYQWYQNGQAISELGTYSFYTDEATTYKKEGTYYVVVRDATGISIQSSVARVIIQEPQVGCSAGSYFTYTVANYDMSYGYFPEYLDPVAPRSKYLLHSSYDKFNFLYPNRSFTGLRDYNVPTNLDYMAKTWISCRTSIPRIHTPTPNPSYSYDSGYGQYDDNGYWTYEGKIEFECHNKKLKLLGNTCKWVNHPDYGNSP